MSQSPAEILNWLTRFPYHAFFQSINSENDRYGQFEWIAAWGSDGCLKIQDFSELATYLKHPEYHWFGGFSYALIETLEPIIRLKKHATISLPEVFLFAADGVIFKRKHRTQAEIIITSESHPNMPAIKHDLDSNHVFVTSTLEYIHYQNIINDILNEIFSGNVYELNFTCEFIVNGRLPLQQLYHQLAAVSQVPFSFWFSWDNVMLLGNSPERFLAKRNQLLVAQPIKGTIIRGKDGAEDFFNWQQLQSNVRFQAENVMIVDLMRNDFHKICLPHSVTVPDLFAVQSLNNLFHLYSTITGVCRQDVTIKDILQAIFPTGSMTGAPKIKAIQLINNYEITGRGAYSGALGYILPSGDFDFSVIIRTLIYDVLRELGSFHVGGAIIAESKAEEEWNELLLKARNIQQVLRSLI